jgi:DNA-binding transcriptional ArsR family regulator
MRNNSCAITIAQLSRYAFQDVGDTRPMAARPELHDPKLLRAIAHPVRNRILTELEASGPLRAADLAARLGVPANSASFHLRQLAKFGLVEEDPKAARDRRDRVWKVTDKNDFDVQLGEIEKMPGGKAASAVFRRTKVAWAHHVVEQAFGEDRTPGTTRTVSEQALRLSRTEALALTEELSSVVETWQQRTRETDSDDRSVYLVFQVVQPFPEHPAER